MMIKVVQAEGSLPVNLLVDTQAASGTYVTGGAHGRQLAPGDARPLRLPLAVCQ